MMAILVFPNLDPLYRLGSTQGKEPRASKDKVLSKAETKVGRGRDAGLGGP